MEESRVLSVQWPRDPSDGRGRSHVASLTSKVVSATALWLALLALLGTFFLTMLRRVTISAVYGSPYLLCDVLLGSYWWMVFGPGRGL